MRLILSFLQVLREARKLSAQRSLSLLQGGQEALCAEASLSPQGGQEALCAEAFLSPQGGREALCAEVSLLS